MSVMSGTSRGYSTMLSCQRPRRLVKASKPASNASARYRTRRRMTKARLRRRDTRARAELKLLMRACPMSQQCLGALLVRAGSVVFRRCMPTAPPRATHQRRFREALRQGRCMILRRGSPTDARVVRPPTDARVVRQHYHLETRASMSCKGSAWAGKIKVADSAFATDVVGVSSSTRS